MQSSNCRRCTLEGLHCLEAPSPKIDNILQENAKTWRPQLIAWKTQPFLQEMLHPHSSEPSLYGLRVCCLGSDHAHACSRSDVGRIDVQSRHILALAPDDEDEDDSDHRPHGDVAPEIIRRLNWCVLG